MELAVLFWFYKEPEICLNRLLLLKKYNSDLKIYGLFGGNQTEANLYKEKLGKYLDDFYISPYKSKAYKWFYGEFMLLDWYRNRGKFMKWDSVVEIQWDTLVFTSLKDMFKEISRNQIFLSGLRLLDNTVENKWDWTDPKTKQSIMYRNFLAYILNKYNYKENPWCWLAILAVFPRIFFEKYQTVKNKKVGFLEYKIPIYAKILKIPFYRKNLGVEWFGKNKYPLNAIPKPIGKKYIEKQLKIKNGWRVFHPYFDYWKIDPEINSG